MLSIGSNILMLIISHYYLQVSHTQKKKMIEILYKNLDSTVYLLN